VRGEPFRPGEFELIARHFRPLAAKYPGALDLSDDAALIDVRPGWRLVATADALIAGVHFLAGDPPSDIARKMLRVNLSDLAAMGAEPLAYLMTLALPSDTNEAWIAAFAEGLAADQAQFAIALAGGDTVATVGPLALSLTALGQVEPGSELRRNAGRAGDVVLVSGTLGDAALGLRVCRGELAGLAPEQQASLVQRYRIPEPRLALGRALVRGRLARAALDVSDGLLADLGHICETSGLGAVVEAARLPLSPAARAALAAAPELIGDALGGGDDYELLFTAEEGALLAIRAAAVAGGVPVTAIGRLTAAPGIRVLDAEGRPVETGRAGWAHF
jgi:thiamine-monophosphate kinase